MKSEESVRHKLFSQFRDTHCKNHNSHSIGVCYIGGLADDGKPLEDTRTEAQKRALKMLLKELHERYPKALIVSHRDLASTKACPCFEVTNFDL